MTSVDEFEPPFPRLAPAWQPLILNPVLKRVLLHTTPQLPQASRCRHYRFASCSTVFSSSTSRKKPPGTTLTRIQHPPFLVPGKGWPTCCLCSFLDETKPIGKRVQKSSFREALPRREPSWGPAGWDDHSPFSLHLLHLLDHIHQDPATEIDNCLADA